MGKKRKELSHEEIWDDSGLIQSWNESYKEYKQYHSIAARGEHVKDVLEAANREQNADNQNPELSHNEMTDNEIQEERDSERKKRIGDENRPDTVIEEAPAASLHDGTLEIKTEAPTDKREQPEIPQSILTNSSSDQGLKTLMMSWYWAGYYTGLIEGQRSAAHQTPPTEKT